MARKNSKTVKKTTADGEVVATYESITEAARANNSTPQRIYARVQWHRPLDGYYYVSDEIAPADKAHRNELRRKLYHARHCNDTRKPRARKPRVLPPMKDGKRRIIGSKYDDDMAKWLGIIPIELRYGARQYMLRQMTVTKCSAKLAFAWWYVRRCPARIYIPSDLVVAMQNNEDDRGANSLLL